MIAGLVVGLVVGAALGLLAGLLVRSPKVAAAEARADAAGARLAEVQAAAQRIEAELGSCRSDLGDLSGQLSASRSEAARSAAALQYEQEAAARRSVEWGEELERLTGVFAELSQKALDQNSESFLKLADMRMKQAQESAQGDLAQRHQAIDELLRPIREQLGKYETGLRQLELDRKEAYSGLVAQVKQLGSANDQLQRETRNLVTALRSPATRGRWGEMQLRRVVEMAGMIAHCDFTEQGTVGDGDGGKLRPDLLVHLPGGAQVVVDAKVSLDAFLHAVDAVDEETRVQHLKSHARQLRTHVDQLAKKEYWRQFDPSPQFVVAFVPGDPLLAAAFEHDPGLVEHAMTNHVLLTTPTTLIALLQTVAYSWQQESLAENARQVQRLGADLYQRLGTLGSHLGKLGRNLAGAVGSYNDTIGSLETRVLVTARKFPELGVVGALEKELPDLEPVAAVPRLVQVPELSPWAGDDELGGLGSGTTPPGTDDPEPLAAESPS